MKIVQASKAYAPHLGGIETIVKQLAEGFAANGVDSSVIVASEPSARRKEQRAGVDVIRVPSYGAVRSVPIAPQYAAELLKTSGDALLVHQPSVLPEAVLALADARLRKRFATIALWWHSDIVRQNILKYAYQPALNRALRNVDVIFAATPNHISSSETLTRFAHKVQVVPFGVDLRRFELTPEIRAKRDAFEARFGPKFVLFVGRLVYYKGIGELVDAMTQVPDAHLVVVGNGPERQAIETSELANTGRLTILPPLDDVDLVALLHASKLLVLPSTEVSEAFGIVQLEAMACNKPVITFNLPTGVTWVNLHNKTGLVAPLGNRAALGQAIRDLLNDDRRRTDLGEQARRRVEEEMTEPRMVQRVLEVLTQMPAPVKVPTRTC